MDELVCAICQQALHEPGEPPLALVCGHPFHQGCVMRYCDQKGCQLEDLPCPVCKKTANDADVIDDTGDDDTTAHPPERIIRCVVTGCYSVIHRIVHEAFYAYHKR